jgi:hypothetical protein
MGHSTRSLGRMTPIEAVKESVVNDRDGRFVAEPATDA